MIANEKIECDVGVIGASLAGSAAAFELSRSCQTSSIVLIDSQEFPREKPCGEGLSSQGLHILQSFGIEPETLPHQRIDGYRICLGRNGSEIPKAPKGRDRGAAGIGLRRSLIDHELLKLASRAPNIRTVLGSAVRKCEQVDDRCELRLSDGRTITCRYVVDASGARRIASPRRSGKLRASLYGSRQHFSIRGGPSIHRVNGIIEPGFEIFVTPIAEEMINVALLAKKGKFAELCRPDGRRHIQRLVERHFGAKLSAQSEVLNIGPVGNWRRSAAEGRVFFVGDACEQLDPIGGMGMTHALRSGSLAAESLASLLCGELSLEEAREAYESRRRGAVRPLRGFTRLTLLLLRRAAQLPLIPILERTPLMTSVSQAVHSLEGPATLSTMLITLAGW